MVSVDLKEFTSHNDPLMAKDWFDATDTPCLTAKDVDMWPSDDKEVLYIPVAEFPKLFTIVQNELLLQYVAAQVDISYVQYLENAVIALKGN